MEGAAQFPEKCKKNIQSRGGNSSCKQFFLGDFYCLFRIFLQFLSHSV